jgi:hypothetical protein
VVGWLVVVIRCIEHMELQRRIPPLPLEYTTFFVIATEVVQVLDVRA